MFFYPVLCAHSDIFIILYTCSTDHHSMRRHLFLKTQICFAADNTFVLSERNVIFIVKAGVTSE